jgi:hypothetical protein
MAELDARKREQQVAFALRREGRMHLGILADQVEWRTNCPLVPLHDSVSLRSIGYTFAISAY